MFLGRVACAFSGLLFNVAFFVLIFPFVVSRLTDSCYEVREFEIEGDEKEAPYSWPFPYAFLLADAD